MITIAKEIQFDMGHRIPTHESKCFNLHGHRYKVIAEVQGDLMQQGEESGMVMDFGFLKACMMSAIHDPYDHHFALYVEDPLVVLLEDHELVSNNLNETDFPGLVIVPAIPTAENLAVIWARDLKRALRTWFQDKGESVQGRGLRLVRLIVHETPTSIVSYDLEYSTSFIR